MKISALLIFLTLAPLAMHSELQAQECRYDVRDLSYELVSKKNNEVLNTKRKYQHSTFVTTVREKGPSGSELIDFRFDLYQSLKYGEKEALPLVVLFPTINGVGFLEKQLAKYLSKRGFHVLIPYSRQEKFDETKDAGEQMDQELARAICGVELVVDHQKELIDFDMYGLSVVGASQGGIRGTTFFNRRKEATALVTSVAAGNRPFLYAFSTQEKIVSFKDNLLRILGLNSNSQLEQRLAMDLKIDPTDHADPTRRDQVWMFISENDTVVPSLAQKQLWEKMGKPQRVLLDSGHAGSVLRLHLNRKNVLNFIQKRVEQ